MHRFENTSMNRESRKRQLKLERVLSVAGELFESKEDLYFSILRRRLEALLDILERAYNSRVDTLRNLRGLILHLHKFMYRHPEFYLIWRSADEG